MKNVAAAALTLGLVTIPVYEVYKVGEDPFWLDGLDVAAKTKRNHHALLSAVLDHAATAGLRAGNPAKGVEIAREALRTYVASLG